MLTQIDIDEILSQFPPLEFAFAYGSGVMEQMGYDYSKKPFELPMIDMVFAVNNPKEWHESNQSMNPSHYTPIVSMSSQTISRIQTKFGGRIWYNTLIQSNLSRFPQRMMKYGVISKNDLIKDLFTWETLYVAGRLHKPVQILKSDPDIMDAMNINKEHAIRTSLLLLQSKFTEKDLYLTIASLSYLGDPRMIFGENPNKVILTQHLHL
jgi:translocator assembly and maintenance protein 41